MLIVQLGFKQQVRHSKNAAERRSDFMIQAGEERAFEPLQFSRRRRRKRRSRGKKPDRFKRTTGGVAGLYQRLGINGHCKEQSPVAMSIGGFKQRVYKIVD
jgi:hypothetical protein